MTRHSLQHSSVNSYHERKSGINSWYDNQWGESSVREGAGSVLEFDHCRLCLHLAKAPMCCPKGYLYCKECIYNFLMQQKLKYKEEVDKYKEQQQKIHDKKQKDEHDNKIKDVIRFEKTEESVHSTEVRLGNKRKASDAPLGYEAYEGEKGKVFLVDKEIVEKHAAVKLSDEEKETRKKYLPCYWIPQLTPQSAETLLKEPSEEQSGLDPFGNPLKRKQLKEVKFTPTPESKKKTKSEKGRWMCPISRKTLTNTTKMCFIKTCGHVVTEESAIMVLKDGVYNGEKLKKKNIIKFEAGGSGFAAGGAKTVKARVAPIFQL